MGVEWGWYSFDYLTMNTSWDYYKVCMQPNIGINGEYQGNIRPTITRYGNQLGHCPENSLLGQLLVPTRSLGRPWNIASSNLLWWLLRPPFAWRLLSPFLGGWSVTEDRESLKRDRTFQQLQYCSWSSWSPSTLPDASSSTSSSLRSNTGS